MPIPFIQAKVGANNYKKNRHLKKIARQKLGNSNAASQLAIWTKI